MTCFLPFSPSHSCVLNTVIEVLQCQQEINICVCLLFVSGLSFDWCLLCVVTQLTLFHMNLGRQEVLEGVEEAAVGDHNWRLHLH